MALTIVSDNGCRGCLGQFRGGSSDLDRRASRFHLSTYLDTDTDILVTHGVYRFTRSLSCSAGPPLRLRLSASLSSLVYRGS